MAHPSLLYGSIIRALRIKDEKSVTSIQMTFFRTAGYTLFGHKRNENILEDLKV
jgi:hypothetical protein